MADADSPHPPEGELSDLPGQSSGEFDGSGQVEHTATFNPSDLDVSYSSPRAIFNHTMNGVVTVLTLSALIPLFSVIIMLLLRGATNLTLSQFWSLPPTALKEEGGFGNALLGTLIMVGISGAISIPFGILSAVFLAEFGSQSRIATIVRFCAKVLSGFPSILAGVFAYGVVVVFFKTSSAWAGGFALSVLMLPVVMLTAEEAIRMVPSKMREASYGMGATRTQTVLRIVLPTAMPNILTGVMLAIARASGETAPLLFTALSSNYWPMFDGQLDLNQPTASLSVMIYNFSGAPEEHLKQMAWTASLVLVLMVLTLNLIGKSFSARQIQR